VKKIIKIYALALSLALAMTTCVYAADDAGFTAVAVNESYTDGEDTEQICAEPENSDDASDAEGKDSGAEADTEAADAGTAADDETEDSDNAAGPEAEASEEVSDAEDPAAEADPDAETAGDETDPEASEDAADAAAEDPEAEEDPETEPEETEDGSDPETEPEETEDGSDPETEAEETESEEDPETEEGPGDETDSEAPEDKTDPEKEEPEDEKTADESTGPDGEKDSKDPSDKDKDTEKDKDTSKTDTEKVKEETEAADAAGGSLRILSLSPNYGKCRLSVTGVPQGASKVKILVWCSPDKSDRRLYKTTLQSDGSYEATVYKYLHSDHTGVYYARAYVWFPDGTKLYAGKKSFTFNNPSPVLNTSYSGGEFTFTAKYIQNASQVSYVKFAVWSNKNGQDDLRWYKGTFSRKDVKASLTSMLSKHKDSGTYYVHAYAVRTDGLDVFIAGSTFDVDRSNMLTCSKIQTTVNNTNGYFRVTILGLNSPKTVRKVRISVWSSSDKSDLKWYTAVDKGGGTYYARSCISNHNYYVGTYMARPKVYYTDGTSEYLSSVKFTLKVSSGKLVIGSGVNETKYPVTLKSLTIPAGAKNVRMAVWSDEQGQDDIVWYKMTGSNGGNYTGTLNIRNHGSAGNYNIHIYYLSRNGEDRFITAGSLWVDPSASVSTKAVGRNDGDSTFRAVLSIADSSSSCRLTKVAVWCSGDMSDIVWYRVSATSRGNYIVNVNTANHYGSRGTYHFSVYAKFANGIEKIVKSFSRYFEPESYLIVAKSNGTCERMVKYVNKSVSSVSFRVWTEKGGEADVHEYKAKVNRNGTFYAVVDMDHCMCDGKYYIQVISGSSVLDSGSFMMIDYLEQAIGYAYDDSIGYSQVHRYLNPDVDCSSLVYYSLKNTGYTVPNYAFATYSMATDLQNAGFTLINYTNVTDLQAGDILLRDGHTEIYAGNGLTVGAHQDENDDIVGRQTGDQTGLEVCVEAIRENWIYAFRLRTYTS